METNLEKHQRDLTVPGNELQLQHRKQPLLLGGFLDLGGQRLSVVVVAADADPLRRRNRSTASWGESP